MLNVGPMIHKLSGTPIVHLLKGLSNFYAYPDIEGSLQVCIKANNMPIYSENSTILER